MQGKNCYNRAEQNYNNPHWHRTSWNNSGELELADPYSTAGKPPTGRLKIPFLLIKYVTFNAFLPKNMHLNFHNRQRKARQKEFVCLNSLLFAHFSHFSLRVCELRSRFSWCCHRIPTLRVTLCELRLTNYGTLPKLPHRTFSPNYLRSFTSTCAVLYWRNCFGVWTAYQNQN